jgi:plasmid stabilization system protein ParE
VKIVVTDAALDDLKRLHLFLNERSPLAAGRAALSIVQAIDALREFPERGRPSTTGSLREFVIPFGHSAYLVRYAVLRDREELVILRVWHSRENRED